MRFLNLEQLKLIDEPKAYRNYRIQMDIKDDRLSPLYEEAKSIFAREKNKIIKEPLPINFVVEIRDTQNFINEDSISLLVNAITAAFIEFQIQNKEGWSRERRLGVPAELQLNIFSSVNNIKKIINTKTLTPCFNFSILAHDLSFHYNFINQRTLITEMEENSHDK